MTVKELKKELEKLGVPDIYYSLVKGGTPNERLCLVKNADSSWSVYYSERGEKDGMIHFDTENAACEYMLNELKEYIE